MKLWHGDDQRERWVGSGLLVAQEQFRRIIGYKQIPALIKELEVRAPSKKAVSRAVTFNGIPGIPSSSKGPCQEISS